LTVTAAAWADDLAGEWVRLKEEAAFSPRDTAEDAVFNNKMWLSNGYFNGNVLIRDLWASADGLEWTLISDNTPYDGYSEMVVFKDKLWAVKDSVWSSTDGVTWVKVLDHTPFGARGYGELVVFQDKMWQLGSGEDVWCTEDGKAWTCALEHAPYGPRYASAVVVFDGKLWVMGGAIQRESDPPEKHYPGMTTFNDVWSSTDGAHWTCVAEHAPWSPRMWFVPKVWKDRLWIVGGFDNAHGVNLGDVWSTAGGMEWERFMPAPGFSPRHEVTCYVYLDSLWVVAGNAWPLMNDVWRLTAE
jgi:hypothetical protein